MDFESIDRNSELQNGIFVQFGLRKDPRQGRRWRIALFASLQIDYSLSTKIRTLNFDALILIDFSHPLLLDLVAYICWVVCNLFGGLCILLKNVWHVHVSKVVLVFAPSEISMACAF